MSEFDYLTKKEKEEVTKKRLQEYAARLTDGVIDDQSLQSESQNSDVQTLAERNRAITKSGKQSEIDKKNSARASLQNEEDNKKIKMMKAKALKAKKDK